MKTNPAIIHRQVRDEQGHDLLRNGILATWKGKPAAKFRDAVAHAMDWIEGKLDEERSEVEGVAV